MGTHQRGERRGKEEGDGGNDWGCGLRRGAPWEGRRSSALLLQLLSVSGGALALCMWEKAGRRKNKGEEKEKEEQEKKKKKKYGKF
jgi:hypothetical protein